MVDGITGSHYASLHNNFTLPNYWSGMYQTIAAPDVTGQTSTKAYRVYVDAHIQSWQQVSWGSIRLIDGDNFGGALIQETVIPNTEYLGNMLVRSHDFAATVPEGYVYSSNPPVLTIEFRYYHAGSDEGPPEWGNIAGFHLDNVRNRYQQCARSPWADADEDHDVDQVDFAAFSRCLTTGGGGIQSGCECFERTDDASIDMSDFVLFQFCANGPDIPAPAHVNCD